ncbi:MAG: SLBB domain-containing protein [Bacteroidetes bacterium]|nr:SLBB domain-containing protein [Bacteroidota bacterium]
MQPSTIGPRFITLAILVLSGISASNAQLGSGLGASSSGASPAAYYYISKPGEITMTVNVWGFVGNPGRYEVPISTDLVDLISFAGGPRPDADLSDVKISRTVRRESKVRTVEYYLDLTRLDRLDQKALDIEPGDTVLIGSVAFTSREVFSLIAIAATVTAAVASLIVATSQ